MPPKEVVKCFESPDDLRRQLIYELSSIFQCNIVEALTPYERLIICSGIFSEAYFVSDALLEVVKMLWERGRNPYCVGVYAGRIRKHKPYIVPSITLANIIFSKLGTYTNSVVVSEDGLKPFLYGKDVLKASVIKTYPKLIPNGYAFIVGPDGQVYGLGIAKVSDEELPQLNNNEVVVRNVFDVGWYLRGGTNPREKKFKI